MAARGSGRRLLAAACAAATLWLAPAISAAPRLETLQQGLAQWQRGTVADMDAAERHLHAALDAWSGQPLDAASRAVLERLAALPVRATTAHEEVAALRIPAYPVAQRAQGLLREDHWRTTVARSAQLLDTNPDGWLDQLRSSSEAAVWLAPLSQQGKVLPTALRARLDTCAAVESRCAQALLSAGPALTPEEFAHLAAQVPEEGLLRMVQALDAANPAQRALLDASLDHPSTAALASARLAARTGDDAQLSALADPERGAAVAASLAARLDADLLARLGTRYAGSHDVLEQQRLLLVLHLNGGPTAAAARQAWLDSPATLAATRQAVQSW